MKGESDKIGPKSKRHRTSIGRPRFDARRESAPGTANRVACITFVTPFFGPSKGIAAGEKAGIETRALDISQVHLEMLKNPRYGYGSQMNPCIDCHGLMLREAGKLMATEGADFLFTGEVLGQRPMSQRRDSLRSVEKLSGLAAASSARLAQNFCPLQ